MLKESSIWGNDNKVVIEVTITFRLFLKTYLDLVETYVASSIRWNSISISILDKFDFYCSFRNNKVSFSYDSNVVG